jgi:FkbM family methyltransferase
MTISDETLESWIAEQSLRLYNDGDPRVLIDVGAFRGDFTNHLLPTFKAAILFEPNPENFRYLKSHFGSHPKVTIANSALGDVSSKRTFHYSDDLATGSVLSYISGTDIHSIEVQQTTLELYLQTNGGLSNVGVLKIDTQGNDLRVLQGAERVLVDSQPILVVELIYAPLYREQNTPEEIMMWLAQRGYVLSAIFNEHYSSEGWLAFADGCFLPAKRIHAPTPPYHSRRSFGELEAEIAMLRGACNERLELINKLHETCEARMQVITRLNGG